MHVIWRTLKIGLPVALVLSFFLLLNPTPAAAGQPEGCWRHNSLICDNFNGHTWFKDQKSHALWYRTDEAINFDNAYVYKNMRSGRTQFLRVGLNARASASHANYAEIGLVEINNYQADFPIPVNTRVEARMRYAPDMKADQASPGTGLGSAGILFWDYHLGPIDYENKILPPPNDAFGFVWQEGGSTPNPGFWVSNVAGAMPGNYMPYPNINLSKWHTYVMERRHDSMTYFIDGEMVLVQPLNQPGSIQLADSQKLTVDFWRDNLRYNFDPLTYSFTITFEDLVKGSYVDLDYFQVSNLD